MVVIDLVCSSVHDDVHFPTVTTRPHSRVTPKDLARRWRIGIPTAKQTLGVTTQLGIRHAIMPLSRRYRTDYLHASNARRIDGKWYGDTLFAKVKSIHGNTCAQVFTNGS